MIYDEDGLPCFEISLDEVVNVVRYLQDAGWIGCGTSKVPQRIQTDIPPGSIQKSVPVSVTPVTNVTNVPVLKQHKTRSKRRRKSFVRRVKVWIRHRKHRLRKAFRSLSRSRKKRAGGSRTVKDRGTRISCGSSRAGAVRCRSGVARVPSKAQ